jgi:DNA mismatch repair protein MSH6
LFISGLPDSVLQNAAAKSREFEGAYGKHRKKFEDGLSNQSLVDEMVEFVQKFMDIAANLSCHKSPESIGTSSLTELQHRAQILLQKI